MNMYLARKNGIQRYQTKIFVFKPGSVITAGNETIFVEPQLISEQKVNSLKNVNNSRKRTLLITTQAHTAPLPRTPTRRTNEGNRTRTHTHTKYTEQSSGVPFASVREQLTWSRLNRCSRGP